MKKVTINLVKIAMISLVLSFFMVKTCRAEVDKDALQGYLNGLSQQAINQYNDPKYAERSNSNETIDPVTGNLILKQTDLSLPGKDGLDLNIGRIYNSADSEYDKEATISSRFLGRGWFFTLLTSNKNTGVDTYSDIGPFTDKETAYNACIDLKSKSTDTLIYSPGEPYETNYYDYVPINTADKYSYDKTRYYLGAGWSFAFPSVEVDEIQAKKYLYFHDGAGATYKVIDTVNNGTSNLEGYQGNDVKFIDDNGTYVNGDNIPSKYKFVSSDQTNYYFAEDGRLLGIKDRFNNEIKLWHVNTQIYDRSFPLISKIQDSVGRIINFTYTGNDITLTVTAPGESNQLQLSYKRSFVTLYNDVAHDTYQYPILNSFTDTLGRTTYYENYSNYNNGTWASERFTFLSRSFAYEPSIDRYLLGAVVYPGSKTIYQYDKVTRNLGTDGIYETYRVKARYDTLQRKNINNNTFEWLAPCNRIDYTYGGDCTAYPDYYYNNTMPNSYQFWSQEAASNGLITKNTFNGSMQLIQTDSTASNNEKKTVKYLEFDPTNKFLPTKTEISEYASDGTLARTLYTGATYNAWGGKSSETQPLTLQQYNDPTTKLKYTTNYYYDDPVYKYFLTKKEWYQNTSTILNETYAYDSLGRIISSKNAKGEITSNNYSNASNGDRIVESSLVLENGKMAKTKQVYGAATAYAYPTEESKFYTNDAGVYTESKTNKSYIMLIGAVKSETDNENKTTTYTYDNAGRILEIQYPDLSNINGENYSVADEYQYIEGYNEEYTEGNYLGIYGTTVTSKTTYTNKATNITQYYKQMNSLYDSYGNLRQERVWDGSQYITQSKYSYDNLQRVISSTDAEGNVITQSYDPWGQVNEETDITGNLYVNQYDLKNSKVASYFVAKNNIAGYRANTASNTYKEDYSEVYLDQFGNTVSRKVYDGWPALSGELSELYTYDISGNLIGYTDPNRSLNENGYTATYQYDGLNRVTEVKDAVNQITDVYYTTLGNISSIKMKQTAGSTDSVTLYTKSYNELGSVTGKTDALSQTTQYSYNTLGLLTGSKDRNGSTSTLTYDGLNQLKETTQVSQDGLKSLGYKYNYNHPYGFNEEQMNYNGILVTTNTYSYDNLGQITQKNVTGSSYINSSLKMQYDIMGRMKNVGVGVKDSSYFFTNYKYVSGKLNKVQTNGQQIVSDTATDNAVYEYYADGNLKKITYPTLNDGSLLTEEYFYNVLGRLTSMVNKKGSTILSQFAYTYDANGNITSINDGTSVKTYIYDKLNRLTEIRLSDGNKTVYSYDLQGNRTTVCSYKNNLNYVNTSLSYRVDNQLESETIGTNKTDMIYYADGLRAMKTTSKGSTYYIYNQSGNLVAEASNTTAVSANYVWGPDRVLSKKVSGGGEYYYLYNGHGDVIQIVDRNGNIVNNYSYDEWGNILTSNETVSNPFKYAGQIYDQETGLYYLRARYYDPSVGRFINEDTVEGQVNNPLSLNPYSYCYNNPVLYIDSTGNSPIDVTRFLARWLIGNPANIYVTQHPNQQIEKLFYIAGFVRDSNGVYHARQDALQQYGGYNYLYDIVFDYATSMEAAHASFRYDGQEFRFWAWKGDYLNLGAGCELGIYTRLVVNGYETDHWLAYTNSNLTMTLRLTDEKGNLIACYYPSDPQWWITAFNPGEPYVKAEDMTATFTINFQDDIVMYYCFINSNDFKTDPKWSISPYETNTVIFTWEGNEE